MCVGVANFPMVHKLLLRINHTLPPLFVHLRNRSCRMAQQERGLGLQCGCLQDLLVASNAQISALSSAIDEVLYLFRNRQMATKSCAQRSSSIGGPRVLVVHASLSRVRACAPTTRSQGCHMSMHTQMPHVMSGVRVHVAVGT